MGQGGEVRGHKAGVTDDGHSLNCVRRKCRLIARCDRYHRLEFASAFGAVQTCVAGSPATDCLMLLVRVDALRPTTLVRPLAPLPLGCNFWPAPRARDVGD